MIDDKVKEIENEVLQKYFQIQRKEMYSELKSKLIYYKLIIQIRFKKKNYQSNFKNNYWALVLNYSLILLITFDFIGLKVWTKNIQIWFTN